MEEDQPSLPRPLGSDVLIKNPLFGKIDYLEEQINKLPPKDKEAFIRKNAFQVWNKVEIISVGSLVRELKEGDQVLCDPSIATTGKLILEGEYILARENQIYAIW